MGNWIPLGGDGFASLHELSIIRCPQLVGQLPNHLPKATKVVIHGCGKLEVSVLNCPRLRMIVIEGCKRMEWGSPVDFGLPNSIILSKISDFSFVTTKLMRGLSKVEYLKIVGCQELTKLWEKIPLGLQRLTFLRELYIEDCSTVVSFPLSGFASMLKVIRIRNCSRLKSLLLGGMMLTSKELVRLSSRGNLPTALKHLEIHSCPMLESIAEWLHHNTTLECMKILNCYSLKFLPQGLRRLCQLRQIQIYRCPNISYFPEEGLPADLRVLRLYNCKKLMALPNCMNSLTSLRELEIRCCPEIQSFSEGGLPTNLKTLVLEDLKIYKPMFEWGLQRLTSLVKLSIHGGYPDLVSFPVDKKNGTMMLPASLSILSIAHFPNLEHLSSKGLESLTSLNQLKISSCPKIISLPKEGLPPSLLQLDINSCPLLSERCRRDRQELSKIAHIPCVVVDNRFIHDLELKLCISDFF
ncbi:hypothetical protein CJ030_MR5G006254 [Morella rubra]|uniref:Disease resistance protein At3g14460 n=1 Tax=Morella rubra TaxID=262757 RepID=A0A6A1VNR0_9ROSI|nr:hypothetical protein CJ030_MR5G006254 [Morella rubra]